MLESGGVLIFKWFQLTAARRRLDSMLPPDNSTTEVSTHSRPKAAGSIEARPYLIFPVSTHSRPKAAGDAALEYCREQEVSTHSRPKAAGSAPICRPPASIGFNSQPPEGGWHRA